MLNASRTAIKAIITARQYEIICLYLDGYRVTDIALKLKITKPTVSRQIKAAKKRINKAEEYVTNRCLDEAFPIRG